MESDSSLVSKVLVLDARRARRAPLRALCAGLRLVPLTVSPSRLLPVLRSQIDLGAILVAEDYGGDIEATVALAGAIRDARPELPLLLCRPASADFSGLPEGAATPFCAAFSLADPAPLEAAVASHIFNLAYPNALVRGILDIGKDVLASQFPGLAVSLPAPSIVRDRLLPGDVFTLIPLDAAWCRGYLHAVSDEALLLAWLRRGEAAADFRRANSLLGEITNLVWGAFKNRYIGDAALDSGSTIQVPIVVNLGKRYISFGTDNPQLAFAFRLDDPAGGLRLDIALRFVFNLAWTPEQFREFLPAVEVGEEAGELELF